MEGTEWVGGRSSAPIYITDGEPYRPDLVLWVDAGAQMILSSRVTHPAESAAAVAGCLAEALRKPFMGPPRRPRRIRIAEPVLIERLRPVVGPDVVIEAAPTPEIDALARLLAAEMPNGDVPASYFEGGRVSVRSVAALFRAAAQLYRAAPWQTLWDSQVLRVEVPDLGLPDGCLSVIGALGESFGLLVYDSIEGHLAMQRACRPSLRTGGAPQDLGTPILSLNFERRADIPASMRREIKRHGWEVAGTAAYPRVMFIEPDAVLRPLTERDVRLVSAVAHALARFYAAHRDRLNDPALVPVTEELLVGDQTDPVVVRLTAPHPESSWETQEGEEDEGDENGVTAHITRIVDGFMREQQQSDSWRGAAGFVSESFLRYKIDYADGQLQRFSVADIREFLLDYFPRKLTVDDAMIERTPDILLAFFAWLERSGMLSQRTAAAIARCIEENRQRFFRYARDESRFGMAKSFCTQMRHAGVDISDQQQIDRFMAGYNATLLAKRVADHIAMPSAAPGPKETDDPLRPVKQRWRPTPGEASPTAGAPCPCGSGRRYKKCCMLR
jgi:hypothetical protein